jgi:glycosyltransferase involved in cell wall biosynthesis
LLEGLGEQDTGGLFTFSIVVVDNDRSESARRIAEEFTAASSIRVTYSVEPRQNIALARNKAVENAKGDFVAFIDDDEMPAGRWLWNLFTARSAYNVAGVLGPVKPYFEHEPPQWVLNGRFFERPVHNTGYRMGMWESRTGNVLFVRSILNGIPEPFRSEFGTAGEDIDFFRRMMEKGDAFIWCNEAIVYELVPRDRCTRTYLLRKALLRGSNFLKHPTDRAKNLVKSFVAIPLYGMMLPFIFLTGHHNFMKYLVKLCDHTGRIMMLFGIELVREREPKKRSAGL